ncbi:glucooligosaccharide oxidase protein [Rutstroemia sp. NJR-2017a BBW]|nr:glucooligosaccharide oxidase protein [Rutstroemia sp. NJR-2017a BBW]
MHNLDEFDEKGESVLNKGKEDDGGVYNRSWSSTKSPVIICIGFIVAMIFSILPLLLTCAVARAASTSSSRLVHCLSASKVPQDIPGSAAWTEDIIPFNTRLNYTPSAFAIPRTVPQVQAAVSCATKLGIKVNPKSGGHSYASHSIGGEDGHLVIDLRYFDDVKLDKTTNEATVGPGARLGNMALSIYNDGGRAIAHGICPRSSVGVGGHVLHGGQGYSSHTYGMMLDFLTGAEVVLANSSVVQTSATKNPDLFWALRGAGMSYGIVTSFTFRTIPAPAENVLFYYGYLWNRTQALTGWTAFQDYAAGYTTPQIPREMNIRVVVFKYDATRLLFLFEGAYHGSQKDFDLAIAPFLASLTNVGGLDEANVVAKSVGWLDSLAYANNNDLYSNWGTGQGLEVPFNFTMFAKSLMTNDLTSAGVDAWINKIYDTGFNTSLSWQIIVAAQGGPTSVVPQLPVKETSYAHRDQLFEWQLAAGVISGAFPTPEAFDFLNNIVGDIEAAESNATLGMYYNYADPSLSAADAHERYWLFNYERLSQIKRAVDPHLVFMNPQTVNV